MNLHVVPQYPGLTTIIASAIKHNYQGETLANHPPWPSTIITIDLVRNMEPTSHHQREGLKEAQSVYCSTPLPESFPLELILAE